MSRRTIFRRAARDDVREARRWYEAQRPALGGAFIESLEVCVAQIERNPELWRRVDGETRRGRLRRFPYVVYYEFAGRRDSDPRRLARPPRSTRLAQALVPPRRCGEPLAAILSWAPAIHPAARPAGEISDSTMATGGPLRPRAEECRRVEIAPPERSWRVPAGAARPGRIGGRAPAGYPRDRPGDRSQPRDFIGVGFGIWCDRVAALAPPPRTPAGVRL